MNNKSIKLNLPSIIDFYKIVDPEDAMNKTKIFEEFILVVTLRAAQELRSELTSTSIEALLKNNNDSVTLTTQNIMKIFIAENKHKELLKKVTEYTEICTQEYLTIQLKTLPKVLYEKCIIKYPDLLKIIKK